MKLWITIAILFIVGFTKSEHIIAKSNETRRILRGRPVSGTRPYMVYLRPAVDADPNEGSWTCGGVIIHPRYILTSAACIEDAKHFYVISGTDKWVSPDVSNDCIKYGAKKAVWKCVPKNYYFDGMEFENIRWMSNDIAVVKVEDEFNFNKRIKGCDYIPKMVAFNNQSDLLEKSRTVGSIAGWGSTEGFGDLLRTSSNSPQLLETDVVIMSKNSCKKLWDPRYHHIIDESMICAKDDMDWDAMSNACAQQNLDCKEMEHNDSEESDNARRFIRVPRRPVVHGARHHDDTRRSKTISGGFCENDHGGPLIVGQGKSAVVVGIISACMTKDITKECYGPFLYTSVWKNRLLISCAIDKDIGASCRRLLRTSKTQMSETEYNWSNLPDGPAKTKAGQSQDKRGPEPNRTSNVNTM